MFADYIGYLASVFIIISLLMKDFRKFRYINIVGCSVWVYYGFVINALPVMLFNSACIVINLFYLFKLYFQKTIFTKKHSQKEK
ncbi:YgjV family protein [Vibrio sp. SCSIO 43137]|uniref:YgjV family protein n=1 Tax=Vibrio sp. SCSIO 43137 TaxID=3021011 RepID=UPI003FCD8EC1